MTSQQAAQWAELTGEPVLAYGRSSLGTGVGPIVGPGRRTVPTDTAVTIVGRLEQVRRAVRGEPLLGPGEVSPSRPPLRGLAEGPGISREEGIARFLGFAALQFLSIAGIAYWPTLDWNVLLPGLKHLGPFLRSLYTIPAGPGPVFFAPAWAAPLLGPTA